MNRERLIQSASERNIMHALLITGPDAEAGYAFAQDIASAFLFGTTDRSRLCDCPDFVCLEPPYKVEMIRAVNDSLSTEAFSNTQGDGDSRWDSRGHRAVLLKQADKMNDSSQNSLLKTLEEPPKSVLFVLAGNENGLLPTIRSRCAVIRLGAENLRDVADALQDSGISPDRAIDAARQADGYYSHAELYAKDEYILFRDAVLSCLETVLFGGTPFPKAAELLKLPVFEASGDGKLKQEGANCIPMLELMQSVMRDALVLKLSTDAPIVALMCGFARNLSNRIAIRFTFAEIQGMINTLGDGMRRISYSANPVQTVDVVLASLMEKEN